MLQCEHIFKSFTGQVYSIHISGYLITELIIGYHHIIHTATLKMYTFSSFHVTIENKTENMCTLT